MLLWMSPSLITLLSLLGLLVTMLDYLGPMLVDRIFSSTQWTGEKEKKTGQCLQIFGQRIAIILILLFFLFKSQDKLSHHTFRGHDHLAPTAGLPGLLGVGDVPLLHPHDGGFDAARPLQERATGQILLHPGVEAGGDGERKEAAVKDYF